MGGPAPGTAPGVAFLEECHRLGAGGIQYPFTAKDALPAREVRRRADPYAMHIEAILDPPRDAADTERFEQTVRVAQEAAPVSPVPSSSPAAATNDSNRSKNFASSKPWA